jgi:hypothetical protein
MFENMLNVIILYFFNYSNYVKIVQLLKNVKIRKLQI